MSKRALHWLLIAGAVAAFVLYLRLPDRQLMSGPDVVLAIQRLHELASVKYSIQKAVGLKEKKSPVGEESILLIVQATVVAGVNLAELTQADIRRQGDTIRIRLPEPRIQHIYVDEQKTQVWDRSVTWWTPWVSQNPDLERKARLEALRQVEETARSMGILDQAKRNAAGTVQAFLRMAGFNEVVIEGAS